MEPKTLKALKVSIKKWERNVRVRNPENAVLHAESCPLCQLFWADRGCDGCPVLEKTKRHFCQGTPYTLAFEHWENWDETLNNLDKKAWQAAAQAEVDFLKSLLPEGETNV